LLFVFKSEYTGVSNIYTVDNVYIEQKMSLSDLLIIFSLLFYLLIIILLIYWIYIAHKLKGKTFFSGNVFLYILIILFTIGVYFIYKVPIVNKNIALQDKSSTSSFSCENLLSRTATLNPNGTFLEDCRKRFCTQNLPVPPFAETSSNFGKLVSQSYPSGSYGCYLVFETKASIKETADWYKAQVPWINKADRSSFYDASDGFNAESEICYDKTKDSLLIGVRKGNNDALSQEAFKNDPNNKNFVYVPFGNTENTIVSLNYEYYSNEDTNDSRWAFFDPLGPGCKPNPYR